MNPRQMLPVCLSLAVALLLLASPVFAQEANARISGIITDPSKAVITGVNVVAVNVDTNVRFPTETNGSGIYVLPALPIGDYRVEVEHIGFKSIVEPGVTLHTQDALELNFEMALGSASETVTVNALATNDSPAVSTVIDHELIEEAPLNGKSLQTLFEVTPGVVLNAGGNPNLGGGFSVDGQRPTANYLTIDGVSGNIYVTPTGGENLTGAGIATSASGGTNGLLPVDAVEEYRMQTSTYSAVYGRTPGGQIEVRTRSGTNEFHGTLFEDLRNQAFDATDWFVKYDGLKQPALRMNDFGGTFGGPILKNRLFIFGAHETLLMHQPQTYSGAVPNSATLATAASVFQPFLAAYPLGNDQRPEGDGYSDLYSESYSNIIADHTTSARADLQLPKGNRFFFRVNDSPSSFNSQYFESDVTSINIQTYTAGLSTQLSPRLLNEVTFNYSSNNGSGVTSFTSVGGNTPQSPITAAGKVVSLSDTTFEFASNRNWLALLMGRSASDQLHQENLTDMLSWTVNKHLLQIGGDFLRKTPTQFHATSDELITGRTTPSNLQTGIADDAYSSAFITNADISLTNLSLYVADTWRVHPRLTLDYGIRWEFNPPPKVGQPGLPELVGSVNDIQDIGVALTTGGVYKTTYSNFAPRLGIATTIRDAGDYSTTVRGGGGIFFDTGSAAAAVQAGGVNGYPFYNNATIITNVPYSSVNWNSLSTAAISLPQSFLYLNDPILTSPRTYQWSLTIDQELGKASSVSGSYIGNIGNELIQSNYYANNATPYIVPTTIINPGGYLIVTTNEGSSNYQALQLQERSKMSRLEALVSYTYGHAIATGSSDFQQIGYERTNLRGSASYDIRQIFSSLISYRPSALGEARVMRAVTGGWSISSITQLQSAAPLSVSSADTLPNEYNGLANIVPGVPTVISQAVDPISLKNVPGGKRLNPAAFTSNSGTSNGTSQINGYRLFGLKQWDAAVSRTWGIWDKANLMFRIDAFNVINTANYGAVSASVGGSNFGEATNTYAGTYGSTSSGSGSLNEVFSNGGPRSVELSLKLKF